MSRFTCQDSSDVYFTVPERFSVDVLVLVQFAHSAHILSSTCMCTCSAHFMKCASHVTCVDLVARHPTLHCIAFHLTIGIIRNSGSYILQSTYVKGCTPKVCTSVYQEMALRCVSDNRVCNIVNLGCLGPVTTGKGSSTFYELIRSNVLFGMAIIIALSQSTERVYNEK